MGSPNRTSFTLTQPFLGAPLQFQPALGSKELEDLVNAYVIGNGSKQDKLSVVTVEFFNLATVDLNTGGLTKTYEVFLNALEQSSVESQSSGFSPPIFTPSPGSSATFGDSGYGSFSIPSNSPPARTLGSARVTKKATKTGTKKAKVEEARIPGFSIMTKDGIDVTTTAGRGTKTKEQREHAHLMRMIKACDACKRKKIRCDPSHARSHNDMSRASVTTTQSSSVSARPSPQYESIPGSAGPALTRSSTQSTTAFTPSNAIDDFILFPEDASWNPEMSQTDLGRFNFDINDMDLNAESSVRNDFSFYQQPFNGDVNVNPHSGHSFYQQQSNSQAGGQQNYTDIPNMADSYDTPGELYDPNQLMPVSHSRPHPSGSNQDSSQIDSSQPGWSGFSTAQRENDNGLLSSTSDWDWSVLESTLIGNSPGCPDQFLTGPSSIPRERVSTSRSPLSSQSSRAITANTDGGAKFEAMTLSRGDSRAVNANYSDPSVQSRSAAASRPTLRYDSGSWISVVPSNVLDVPLLSSGQRPSPAAVLRSISDNCRQVSEWLQIVKPSRLEYTGLCKDLHRLRAVVGVLQSRQTVVPEPALVEARSFHARLDKLSAQLGSLRSPLLAVLDPDYHAEFFPQCQVEARRLVRSLCLCAKINVVQAQNPSTHVPANTSTLNSSRNIQLAHSPSQGMPHASLISGAGMGTESTIVWQTSNDQWANLLPEDTTSEILGGVASVNELHSSPMSKEASRTLSLPIFRNIPMCSIMAKDAHGQHEALERRLSDGTSYLDVLSVSTVRVAEDSSSVLANAGIFSQHNDLLMVDRTQTSSPAQYVDSSQEFDLATQARSFSAMSANLETTAAVKVSLPSTANSSLQLLAAAVLAVLGSMFLFSMIPTSIWTSTLAVSSSARDLQTIAALRESCNEWIGNDAFSVAKLALVIVMAAQLPPPTQSNVLRGGVTLFHLTAARMSPEKSRKSTSDSVVSMDGGRGIMGLLATMMMMDFSPVFVVQ